MRLARTIQNGVARTGRHFPIYRSLSSLSPDLSTLKPKEILTIFHDTKGFGKEPKKLAGAFGHISKYCMLSPASTEDVVADPRMSNLLDDLKAAPLQELSMNQLVNLGTGMSVLGVKDGEFMNVWVDALIAKSPEATPGLIANALLALARLEYRSQEALDCLTACIETTAKDFGGRELSVTLNGLAVFGAKKESTLQALSEAAIKNIDGFDPVHISQSLVAFAAFEFRNMPMVDAYERAIISKIDEFGAPELVRTINGMVFFHRKSSQLLQALCAQALANVEDYDAVGVVSLMSGMARLKLEDQDFIEKFIPRTMAVARDFTPVHITILMAALAQLCTSFRPQLLLHRLCTMAAQNASDFTSQDILSTLTAMATLELRHEEAIIALGEEAKTRTRDYNLADGKRIMEVLEYLMKMGEEEGGEPKPEPKDDGPSFKIYQDV